jgi:branched-chain amino acid transport system ATP-binding protein
MGLLPPSKGRVVYGGNTIAGMAPFQIARLGLGYIPEDRRIFPSLTVHENLLIGTKAPVNGGPPPWTLQSIFKFFPKLKERSRQRAGTLSGGEQQMLTIGRTLMGNPDFILIDEPMEGLAPMIVEQVELLLAELHRDGTPVLLVEQSMETALTLADRAYVMSKGRIVFSGSIESLRRDDSIRRKYLQV